MSVGQRRGSTGAAQPLVSRVVGAIRVGSDGRAYAAHHLERGLLLGRYRGTLRPEIDAQNGFIYRIMNMSEQQPFVYLDGGENLAEFGLHFEHGLSEDGVNEATRYIRFAANLEEQNVIAVQSSIGNMSFVVSKAVPAGAELLCWYPRSVEQRSQRESHVASASMTVSDSHAEQNSADSQKDGSSSNAPETKGLMGDIATTFNADFNGEIHRTPTKTGVPETELIPETPPRSLITAARLELMTSPRVRVHFSDAAGNDRRIMITSDGDVSLKPTVVRSFDCFSEARVACVAMPRITRSQLSKSLGVSSSLSSSSKNLSDPNLQDQTAGGSVAAFDPKILDGGSDVKIDRCVHEQKVVFRAAVVALNRMSQDTIDQLTVNSARRRQLQVDCRQKAISDLVSVSQVDDSVSDTIKKIIDAIEDAPLCSDTDKDNCGGGVVSVIPVIQITGDICDNLATITDDNCSDTNQGLTHETSVNNNARVSGNVNIGEASLESESMLDDHDRCASIENNNASSIKVETTDKMKVNNADDGSSCCQGDITKSLIDLDTHGVSSADKKTIEPQQGVKKAIKTTSRTSSSSKRAKVEKGSSDDGSRRNNSQRSKSSSERRRDVARQSVSKFRCDDSASSQVKPDGIVPSANNVDIVSTLNNDAVNLHDKNECRTKLESLPTENLVPQQESTLCSVSLVKERNSSIIGGVDEKDVLIKETKTDDEAVSLQQADHSTKEGQISDQVENKEVANSGGNEIVLTADNSKDVNNPVSKLTEPPTAVVHTAGSTTPIRKDSRKRPSKSSRTSTTDSNDKMVGSEGQKRKSESNGEKRRRSEKSRTPRAASKVNSSHPNPKLPTDSITTNSVADVNVSALLSVNEIKKEPSTDISDSIETVSKADIDIKKEPNASESGTDVDDEFVEMVNKSRIKKTRNTRVLRSRSQSTESDTSQNANTLCRSQSRRRASPKRKQPSSSSRPASVPSDQESVARTADDSSASYDASIEAVVRAAETDHDFTTEVEIKIEPDTSPLKCSESKTKARRTSGSGKRKLSADRKVTSIGTKKTRRSNDKTPHSKKNDSSMADESIIRNDGGQFKSSSMVPIEITASSAPSFVHPTSPVAATSRVNEPEGLLVSLMLHKKFVPTMSTTTSKSVVTAAEVGVAVAAVRDSRCTSDDATEVMSSPHGSDPEAECSATKNQNSNNVVINMKPEENKQQTVFSETTAATVVNNGRVCDVNRFTAEELVPFVQKALIGCLDGYRCHLCKTSKAFHLRYTLLEHYRHNHLLIV